MNTMHPHWQTTDEDEVPVRILTPETVATGMPRARRTPAAIIGIALFIGIGFAAFRGAGNIIGQLMADDGILVTITPEGVDPPLLTVRRGETITWENSDTIPHILSSETLPTDDGQPFLSTAIQPDARFSYTVPADAEGATHDYISRTSAAIAGQIIIDPSPAPLEDTTAASAESSDASVPAAVASSASSASSVSFPSSYPPSVFPPVIPGGMNVSSLHGAPDAGATASENGIPQNPYTIGSSTVIPPPRGTAITAAVSQHHPVTQPETGTGIWMLAVPGILAFWFAMRRALAAQ